MSLLNSNKNSWSEILVVQSLKLIQNCKMYFEYSLILTTPDNKLF